jgi:hypothetical protein
MGGTRAIFIVYVTLIVTGLALSILIGVTDR